MTDRDPLTELLDQIDPMRYDVDAIVAKLNEYANLSGDEQDAYADGIWMYAGVDQAGHVLTSFCGESHNGFVVVRDLDGSLQFVFETTSTSGRWEVGPLYQQHLSDLDLEGYFDTDELMDEELPLSHDQLRTLIAALPDDPPGPLRSY